jgi:HSP20 family protein
MTLMLRQDPFSNEMSRLFNTLLGAQNSESGSWIPAMDLVEAEDHFVLKADLPGLSEGDVDIEVRDNTLRVSGERKTEHERRERGWYRVERSFGKFSRSLTLPDGVDPEGISATFDKGVLEVRVPKPEERKPRRISIGNDRQEAVEGKATEK